ncbi:MAG: beta-galactosidase [Chloroflexota bacterium]|nr:beta-galactosidase [Chloroflexota bacterium]
MEQPSPAIGVAFSPRQAAYLGLPWDEIYRAALGLTPRMVRLGAYWDEIEPAEGKYDWSTLDVQIEQAEARGVPVVLTIGMKAPRYPEYFLPPWLRQRLDLAHGATVSDVEELRTRTLAFVERVVGRYRDHPALAYWQVENEPLIPAGPHRWTIGLSFLTREVALVRELDGRPIIVTMFAEVDPTMLLPWRQRELRTQAMKILDVADILGLDIYPNLGVRALRRDWYFHWPAWLWTPSIVGLRRLAQRMGRRAWITEAQAEPWEPGVLVHTAPAPSRSVTPAGAAATVAHLRELGFDVLLLWGVEHWHMRRVRHRDPTWWAHMLAFFPRGRR